MKKMLFIVISILMIFSFYNTVTASDITISGSSQFDCSLISKYMKKHGYFYIGQTSNDNFVNVNTFAAMDAIVIVNDEYNDFLGTGTTDKKGNFLITVPKKDVYKVIVRFHGQESRKVVQFPKIEDVTIDLGYFSSEVVGGWFQTASLSN